MPSTSSDGSESLSHRVDAIKKAVHVKIKKQRAAPILADDVRIAGFAPSPHALLTCVAGPALGRSRRLDAGWHSQSWSLDENLNSASTKTTTGLRIRCVNCVYSVQAINNSALWLSASAALGGPGLLRVDSATRGVLGL